MDNKVTLECSCGAIKGELQIVKGSYFHVECLCCDCQKFASYLQNETKILNEYGGSELFQTYPAFMSINEGKENIACVQLRDKGLLRWYSSCCNMPIANTMASSGVPFVGVSVKLMKFENEQQKLAAIGPVSMKAFGKYAVGDMPSDAYEKFPISFMPKILGFMLKGMIKKLNSPSPFFNNKLPIKKSSVLTPKTL